MPCRNDVRRKTPNYGKDAQSYKLTELALREFGVSEIHLLQNLRAAFMHLSASVTGNSNFDLYFDLYRISFVGTVFGKPTHIYIQAMLSQQVSEIRRQ